MRRVIHYSLVAQAHNAATCARSSASPPPPPRERARPCRSAIPKPRCRASRLSRRSTAVALALAFARAREPRHPRPIRSVALAAAVSSRRLRVRLRARAAVGSGTRARARGFAASVSRPQSRAALAGLRAGPPRAGSASRSLGRWRQAVPDYSGSSDMLSCDRWTPQQPPPPEWGSPPQQGEAAVEPASQDHALHSPFVVSSLEAGEADASTPSRGLVRREAVPIPDAPHTFLTARAFFTYPAHRPLPPRSPKLAEGVLSEVRRGAAYE